MPAPPNLLAVADGHAVPALWSVLPFVVTLLGIAILPLVVPHWWESNRNRAKFAWVIAVPTAIWWVLGYGWHGLLHEWSEYCSFILLLGSLYVAAGGIFLGIRVTPGATSNTIICAIGAVIANIVGTTGASMLLIRPYMKANAHRPMRARILSVVFFIFMVSNIGGCLTPLGDPPLFLGFLKGVPFEWTLQLWKEWAFALAILLTLFHVWDRLLFRREPPPPPAPVNPGDGAIEGRRNIWLLMAVMGAVLAKGMFNWGFGPQEAIMALVIIVSMAITRKEVRKKNHFTFGPILEVAILFSGIFTVMVPVLAILKAKGGEMGLDQPWHYFWVTGILSSFLDNAPTYLVFAQTAASQVGVDKVGQLVDQGASFLAAVSVGAVFMGANTYIGNGPNFMVKAIAEENGIVMPSFFGFMKYSLLILAPLFVLVTFVFF